ncbi:UNVERIFIED_CONTAM: Methyl-CpG-binding domain-containing protein 9 [Sesamum calycinum]|uniref:Methyl-CpG-binding domain-containing protein 9 n=1 Tax=Sesamum calycinum TaxID=2727403 RepID=A0AAW2PTR7_9LAMI
MLKVIVSLKELAYWFSLFQFYRSHVPICRIHASVRSSFSSHLATKRPLNPLLDDIGNNFPTTSSVATAANAGFRDMLQQKVLFDRNLGTVHKESVFELGLLAGHSSRVEFPPESPNMLYLQTLREYIAERSGVLGEGWRVEFEFCDQTCKTSAVYIAPDGSRIRSMEDVARHLGLQSRYHYLETENGSNEFAVSRTGLKIDPVKKVSSAFLAAQNCRQRQRGSNSQGFLSSSGTIGGSETNDNKSIKEVGYHDGFPIQFHDFCLISAGIVDPRPSYHNTDQIWPVGYRASWHDRITGSLFVCDVADGGDSGPIFKIQRYPCTMQSTPVGSTILSKKKQIPCKGDDQVSKDDLVTFEVVDDDSISTITLLNEDSPPCLENCLTNSKREDEHPGLVQNENEFNMACDMLMIWLNQDRFGLDADFVQEIIEQLPGVTACSEYKNLNDRKHNSGLQTVGSGFLLAERKTNFASGTSKRSQLKSGDQADTLKRDPGPPGKPLNSSLPSYLLGDALQVWELAWRFLEVLGLEQPFSFHELESELVSPWLDSYPLDSRYETVDIRDAAPSGSEKASQAGAACHGRCTGLLLAKILGSLLKLLVSELLSKAAVYVCPNFDAGESKSRRGRKKDLDCLAALKKTKIDMLPVNELTWQEIARRYIWLFYPWRVILIQQRLLAVKAGKFSIVYEVLADAMKEIFGSLKSKNEVVSLCERESDINGAQTIEVSDSVIPEWAQVLEPVRKLPTNVGARIRRCINEALERNPPDWAKKILEHSISKEVYKGNASGPTKRAVISVLANVSSENPQQKTEKKEKVKIKTNLADLISKQCRIVLRRAAASDEDRVFCNLLARVLLSPNDNDDEGLLGYPAMVSRPLDFRTIDLRLAAGAYGGSHEAFVDDVREVWHNIRTAYGDRSDLIDVAEKLSNKFEDLYEKEVLTLVHKIAETSNTNDSSADAIKERDDLLAHVCNSSLPRAPWDEGICKVCGMDKDDDNVLLCDKCDSEYHRYCLNPPLLRIPEGNWYCPSCVVGQSVSCTAAYGSAATQSRKRRYQGQFTRKFLEELARLANLMEIKEYWEFTIEERIFFMKFLFDEALNSATIREHMDQCASRAADLQIKLRTLTSELKLLKVKEDMLGLSTEKANSGVFNGRGDLKSDASSSLLAIENISRGKPSDKGSHLPPFPGFTQLEDGPCLNEEVDCNKQPNWPPSRSNKGVSSSDMLSQSQTQQLVSDHGQQVHAQSSRGTSWQYELPNQRHTSAVRDLQVMPGCNYSSSTCDPVTVPAPMSSVHESRGNLCPDQADMPSSQDNSHKVSTFKNDISNLQHSIASIESELLKVSLRKDFLGRDSNGRAYWAFYCPGARPWVVACGDLASKERRPEEFISIPDSDKWVYYESDTEIEKLVGWLRENNLREKELRESILLLQSNKMKDSEYTESHILSKGETDHNGKNTLSADFLVIKAMTALEKRFGPCLQTEATDACQILASRASQDGRMSRCECLELLWPSKDHCPSCHQSFPSIEELRQHSKENCIAAASVSKRTQAAEDISKRKKSRNVASQEKRLGNTSILQISTSEKQSDESNLVDRYHAECPFNFEEIVSRFIIPNSVKDVVNDIGLIGTGGIPSFLPSGSPHLSDPALTLGSRRIHEASSSDMPTDLRIKWQHSGNETSAAVSKKANKESNRLSRCDENGLAEESSTVERLKSILMTERDQVSSMKDKGSLLGLPKSSIIPESSSRPLVGRASEILRFLKISLLDIYAALPEDALRKSRSNQDRRHAWCGFVKSARSIYEMVQATIILEDTIKSEYLRNDWYWSSPSTAAKITTLSALALRIYSLDAAISYEKPLPGGAMEIPEPSCAMDEDTPPGTTSKNVANSSSPPSRKTPEPDPADNPRTRSRTSKRRKDMNS